jgi:Flp pilus assembly protein TadG
MITTEQFCRSRRRGAHIDSRWTTSGRTERGSAAVELVVLAPVLIVMLLFAVFVGRLAEANTLVRHAADQAARAASQSAREHMSMAASDSAVSDLSQNGVSCGSPMITTQPLQRGDLATVTVTVACELSRESLLPLAPGVQTVTASSTEVIDFYRADAAP